MKPTRALLSLLSSPSNPAPESAGGDAGWAEKELSEALETAGRSPLT